MYSNVCICNPVCRMHVHMYSCKSIYPVCTCTCARTLLFKTRAFVCKQTDHSPARVVFVASVQRKSFDLCFRNSNQLLLVGDVINVNAQFHHRPPVLEHRDVLNHDLVHALCALVERLEHVTVCGSDEHDVIEAVLCCVHLPVHCDLRQTKTETKYKLTTLMHWIVYPFTTFYECITTLKSLRIFMHYVLIESIMSPYLELACINTG